MKRATLTAVVLGLLAVFAPPTFAQVDCSDPDNLCTGDPCVIPSLVLPATCNVTFGTRALVIDGLLDVPDGGTVAFHARTIDLRRPIVARDADVSLSADEDCVLYGAFRLSGAGALTITAGNDVTITRSIQAPAFVDISITAGRDVTVHRSIRRITQSFGGSLVVDAGRQLSINSRIRMRGGSTALRGAHFVTIEGDIIAPAGALEITSAMGPILEFRPIAVQASQGGSVTVTAASNVYLDRVFAHGTLDQGGSVTVTSNGGNVVLNGDVLVRGGPREPGGTAQVTAAGYVHVNGDIDANRLGTIRVRGAEVLVGPGSLLRSNGTRGSFAGPIWLRATAGDMTLSGRFEAIGDSPAPSGLIEGVASGNLLANGTFTTTGCIGLSAGGTLDTSGGTFSGPIVPDCPGSPSGAFLDLGAP